MSVALRSLESEQKAQAAFIKKHFTNHLDANVKEPNTIIVIGRVGGQEICTTYTLPAGSFEHVYKVLLQLSRYSRSGVRDVPSGHRRFFDI